MTSVALLPMSFARRCEIHFLFFFSSLAQFDIADLYLALGKVESCNLSHRTNSVRIT